MPALYHPDLFSSLNTKTCHAKLNTVNFANMKIFGKAEQGAIKQAENCLVDADAFILMADNHKGYGMPVGGVAVYADKITPAGVGFDIACGNKAVKLDLKLADIQEKLPELADQIWHALSFGVGRKNSTPIQHALFEDTTWSSSSFLSSKPDLKKKAAEQLGTIGSGNHYVDVFADEEDFVWIGVHFGSRGLGHTIASHFMQLAGDNINIIDERPHTLLIDSPEGQEYIACMELAGRYAYAGRDWVCQRVAEILGGQIVDEVHNHHNFAWKERHGDKDYWVVRKGATPAFPGQRGFVGSCMSDTSLIIKGIDSPASREAFYSTVHGAGRIMSRTQAAGKKRIKQQFRCGNRDCDGYVDFYELKPNEPTPKCPICGSKTHKFKGWVQTEKGVVDFEAVQERMRKAGIILKGAGADEAPEVYKKLEEVIQEHAGTVEILHRLKPLIVCMAGGDEFDPYKD
jgi:tRNA-splicing ligase RtcB